MFHVKHREGRRKRERFDAMRSTRRRGAQDAKDAGRRMIGATRGQGRRFGAKDARPGGDSA